MEFYFHHSAAVRKIFKGTKSLYKYTKEGNSIIKNRLPSDDIEISHWSVSNKKNTGRDKREIKKGSSPQAASYSVSLVEMNSRPKSATSPMVPPKPSSMAAWGAASSRRSCPGAASAGPDTAAASLPPSSKDDPSANRRLL